ncbi:MAG: DUF4345 family protein [Rhizobiaceae bacterium]|nr:DUF4345 family protein [Rhizobiaceae bacterium]
MEFALPLPQTQADLAIYASAAVTGLVGLTALFAPRLMLQAMRFRTADIYPAAVAEMRSTIGGFYVGIGLMGLLFFEQFTIPLVLGTAWLVAAFGRLVSILSDRGPALTNTVLLLADLALALLPLAALFGLLAT